VVALAGGPASLASPTADADGWAGINPTGLCVNGPSGRRSSLGAGRVAAVVSEGAGGCPSVQPSQVPSARIMPMDACFIVEG
jgi:hypothetical protein